MAGRPSIIISMLRLFACFMIFCHHYLKTIGAIKHYTLSVVVACGVFTFISGYLTYKNERPPGKWLKDQLIKIYIPFLLIIVPLIVFCYVTGFKQVSFSHIIVELGGGSLFLDKAVLEQGWYITFIMGTYLVAYATKKELLINRTITCLSASFAYYCVLVFTAGPEYITKQRLLVWIFCYFLGFVVATAGEKFAASTERIYEYLKLPNEVNRFIYRISLYAFAFFLVHPIPLNLFYKILKFNPETTLIMSLISSMILGYLLQNISARLIAGINSKHLSNPIRLDNERI